jgi:FkbM family methyltransferase
MKIEKINGFWVPSNDIHREQWLDGAKLMQNKCITKFLEYCDTQHKTFRTVLDIGAWCGTWSKLMEPYAKKVIAFEPDRIHFECLQKNCTINCIPRREAVGNEVKNVSLTKNDFTQQKRVAGEGDISMVRIDDFDYQDVDLIKIDVEGYELEVLKGAQNTLQKIEYLMIELNGNTEKYGSSNKECIDFILAQGFKLLMKVWPDKIFYRIK